MDYPSPRNEKGPKWLGYVAVAIFLLIFSVFIALSVKRQMKKVSNSVDVVKRDLAYEAKHQKVQGNYCVKSAFGEPRKDALNLEIHLPSCNKERETHIEFIRNPTLDREQYCYSRVCETKPGYRSLLKQALL